MQATSLGPISTTSEAGRSLTLDALSSLLPTTCAGFGCPTDKHYAWAKPLYDDPLLDAWPRLISEIGRAHV